MAILSLGLSTEQLITDYAVLAGADLKPLPPDFTICSSVSSAAFTTALSFFQLLQSNGDPWINLFVVVPPANRTFIMGELMVVDNTDNLGELVEVRRISAGWSRTFWFLRLRLEKYGRIDFHWENVPTGTKIYPSKE